jgi:hypothetical protein
LSSASFAQTDTSYLNFIYEGIRYGQQNGTIHYASNLKPFEIKEWAHKLYKKHLIGYVERDDQDTLTLTREERKYIQKQLKTSLNSSWPDKMFPDSKVLSADSINKFVQDTNLVILKARWEMDTPGNRLNHVFWGFRFSRPIFLRGNSLLIFYLKRFATFGGEENVIVYRKEGNSWKRWMLVYGVAW